MTSEERKERKANFDEAQKKRHKALLKLLNSRSSVQEALRLFTVRR